MYKKTGVAFLYMAAMAAAESTVVWQIGKFDESSYEFRQGGASAVDPVFIVGKSETREWYADQPGTSNGLAGFRAHPFTIRFDLPQAPSGLYTLKLALLAYSPRLPILQASINGHSGRFYQNPVLNYGAGTTSGHYICHYSSVALEFDLPARFLQPGTNTLVLTAVDDPATRDDSQGVTVRGNSVIIYDALALLHDPGKTYAPDTISVKVTPTIFYRQANGGLTEDVDVIVRHNDAVRGNVALAAGSYRQQAPLREDVAFGEQRLRFAVPEFRGPAAAVVSVAGREFNQTLTPGKKWNIFVAPHQHMDIGYTDYPPKVAEVQSRAIDEAMEMMRKHPDFRYTLDSYWVAEQFLAGRSGTQKNEFLQLIREKKILLPAQYAGNYTGVPGLEYLLRSFYHSYRLNRENGGDFDHAFITDIPSHSWSYPSVMASAGLKYLLLPANQDLGPILLLGRLHEKAPFWWEGPDGGRVFTWYSRHYLQVFSMFGMPPKIEAGRDSLPTFLQMYTRPDYNSDGVLVFGTQVENTDLYEEQAALASDWNRVYAWPKMKFTGISEALGYIARQMGGTAPVVRGDGGPYWDVFTSGQAQAAAVARENEHRVLAAEKLSTIASLLNPRTRPDRDALDRLWKGLLAYQEHTSGGGKNLELRLRHSKPPLAQENMRLVDSVSMRGMSIIADTLHAPAGMLVVFNPLNWKRSKLVEFDLPRNMELVNMATGRVVDIEELTARAPGPFTGSRPAAGRRVRFLAEDVPSLGYRSYAIRPGRPAAPAGAAAVMENRWYRVKLDAATGAVSGVFDKETGREMVDAASPYRFNQYLLATGEQDRRSRQAVSTKVVPPPQLTITGASGGRVVSITKTPFGIVARLESSAPTTPRISTEIILHDREKKIEITNRLLKEPATSGEWGYFAFPFAMERPQFRFEIQNGIVDPARDVLPGGSREWSPVQHWASVSDGEVAAAVIPVDNSLVTFGDVIRYRWPKEFGKRKPVIFSHLFQGGGTAGELTYRYVITTGRGLKPEQLSRLGWEAMSPLELNEIIEQDKVGNPPRPLAPAQGSFVETDGSGAILLTWKLAEDGQGTIMRFVDTTGQGGRVRVTSPLLRIDKGWICNSVEENQRPLDVSSGGFDFNLKPFQIVTVRLAGTPLVSN